MAQRGKGRVSTPILCGDRRRVISNRVSVEIQQSDNPEHAHLGTAQIGHEDLQTLIENVSIFA